MARRTIQKLFALSLCCIIVLGGWAFWLEPASLFNENHRMVVPSWPAECDGIRVALLADLHVGSPYNGTDKLAKIVDLTLAAKPDLILLLGDYVIGRVLGGTYIPPETIADGLRRLSAPMGVFAVLGNHDRYHDAKRIEKAFDAVGIRLLEDAAVSLVSGKCRFWLVGLSDFWEGPRDYNAALSEVPRGAPVVAFTHNPDLFPQLPDNVNVTFAGHTHGGQVYLPIVGRMIVPSQYHQRFAAGHIVEGGRHLFVSPGLGTSIVPVRFLVPPEVSVVTMQSAEAKHGEGT